MAFNENVLARAREREYKMGISYQKKDGRLYKTLKWIYALAVSFTAVITSFYVLGFILLYFEDMIANVSKTKNYGISFVLNVVLMIAMLIISKFNEKPIIASIFGTVNLASSIFLVITFANYYHEWQVYLSAKFYWLHLVPILIIILCSSIITFIVIRSYFKTRKAYNMVLDILFRQYNALPENEKPDWEEYVNNFEF